MVHGIAGCRVLVRVGGESVFDELDRGLARIRSFLLDGVRSGEAMGSSTGSSTSSWRSAAGRAATVLPRPRLGHLVFPLGYEPDRPSPIPGFGTAAAESLLAAGHAALEDARAYPVWNGSPLADHPAAAGLWAVEPHVGRDGVGVKFEELLVVTEDDAYWLDDHLLHAQRWAAAGYSIEPLRRV